MMRSPAKSQAVFLSMQFIPEDIRHTKLPTEPLPHALAMCGWL